jgi:nitrogen fixation protein NifU and related proteins
MSEHIDGEELEPGAARMPDYPLESLYQEIIASHSRGPRNNRELEHADVRVQRHNPSCGDEIRLSIRMEGGRIVGIGFTGEGCSISQASASMMTVLLEGRTLAEAEELTRTFAELVQGRATPAATRTLGELRALGGVAKFPVRVRCALLAWDALREASSRLPGRSNP